jgi:predicted Zn-dependent protease
MSKWKRSATTHLVIGAPTNHAPSKPFRQRKGSLPGRCLLILLLGLWSAIAITGCSPPSQSQARGPGPGGRAQELALTQEQEIALGEKAYREILSKAKVVAGGAEPERVRRVGAKIAHAAEIEPLQREINLRVRGFKFHWEFNVLQDKQINAFCLPGGKVAVFSGLLPVAATDAQLATVMAHEVAHALAHHTSERLARQKSDGGGFLDLFVGKAHDREQESEADHIGLFLMTFAGYDPEQAVVFWERMRSATSNSAHPPEILSDHPSDGRRIAQMGSWVAPAKAAKRAYDEGRVLPRTGK